MRIIILILFVLGWSGTLQAQTEISHVRIPLDAISLAEGDRAGSCASPDGPILGDVLDGYPPSYNWLNNNGYCYDIPTTKNATWCWTFTSPGTTVTLDCGFSVDVCGGAWAYWFSAFKLYTCAPSCTLVGTGLTFAGLTPGACYTWCFNTNFDGCGAAYGFTTLCPYVIYDGPPLPVELVDFSAYSENSAVYLQWETASESNCYQYEVLRSTDGISFELIGSVNGNGTTTFGSSYSFDDMQAPQGTCYYQLRQVDFDMTAQYSNIISCTTQFEQAVRRYYNLTGSLVSLEDAPAGLYIEEIASGMQIVRRLYYHSR